jgi:hypothetical protein
MHGLRLWGDCLLPDTLESFDPDIRDVARAFLADQRSNVQH